jgi:hypothetical protein
VESDQRILGADQIARRLFSLNDEVLNRGMALATIFEYDSSIFRCKPSQMESDTSLAILHRLIVINDCNQFGRPVHREIMQQSRTLPLIARERMSTDGTQCVMRINREKVLASLNKTCPSPDLVKRVNFEQIECPKCGAKFQPTEWERN